MKTTLVVSIFVLFLAAGSAAFVHAGDVMDAAPQCCKVLLENEEVRVLDYVAKAGEKVGLHMHPAHVVYSLTDGKVKFTSEDGSTREVEMKAGQAIYSAAVTHATENTSANDMHVIIVEMKK